MSKIPVICCMCCFLIVCVCFLDLFVQLHFIQVCITTSEFLQGFVSTHIVIYTWIVKMMTTRGFLVLYNPGLAAL